MRRTCYLVCLATKQAIWIGQNVGVLAPDVQTTEYFHRPSASNLQNWRQDLLSQSLWKFLAETEGHELKVVPDDEYYDLWDESWVEIGGDKIMDIPFEDYVRKWRGL